MTRPVPRPLALRTAVTRPLVAACVVVLATVLGAPAASAHPLGPPQVAKVTANGTTVVVTWSAADDDLVALGVRVGALPKSAAIPKDPGVRAAVADAAAGYLGERLSVSQAHHACARGAVNTAGLWDDGASFEFACAEPVNRVSLRITALTDLDPAYRTVSVSGTGSGALHTAGAPEHEIELTGERRNGPAAVLVTTAGGVLIAALLIVLWRRKVSRLRA